MRYYILLIFLYFYIFSYIYEKIQPSLTDCAEKTTHMYIGE